MISLNWQSVEADIELNDLLTNVVTTEVIASLFSDRRASASDEIPDGGINRRGWWGDSYRSELLGSRLWLLSREKQLKTVLDKTHAYAEEALAWMPKAGCIRNYQVNVTNPASGVLMLSVMILLNDGSTLPLSFKASLNGV